MLRAVVGEIRRLLILLSPFAVKVLSEEITHLPGSENISLNFKQYSGYVQGYTATHFQFYWFVESQGDAANDPLIFWFNGGPGCSSVQGLLMELGPFHVNEDGKTLEINNYSWNKMSSIVFLESPARVGFSYCLKDEDVYYNDTVNAKENYAAFKNFFKQFPAFIHHKIFIMGESYGAVYSSMLLELIIDGMDEFPVNVEGLAIGNGNVDDELKVSIKSFVGYSFGIVSEQEWVGVKRCCKSTCIRKCLRQNRALTRNCFLDLEMHFLATYNSYDYYRKCFENEVSSSVLFRAAMLISEHTMSYNRLAIMMTQKNDGISCIDSRAIDKYLNSAEVRKALHVSNKAREKWLICGYLITYDKTFLNLDQQFKKILGANIRILLFYGDTDIVCPALLGQIFCDRLQRKLIAKKLPWYYAGNLNGYKTEYENLTFLTIRGTGHMVPEWKPEIMQSVVKQFLNNEPIGEPLLIKNGQHVPEDNSPEHDSFENNGQKMVHLKWNLLSSACVLIAGALALVLLIL